MALTKEEKDILDNVLLELVEQLYTDKTSFTSKGMTKMIEDKVDFDITPASIIPAFNRILKGKPYILFYIGKGYFLEKKDVIIGANSSFIKEKNLLVFNCEVGNLSYDFITNKFSHNVENIYWGKCITVTKKQLSLLPKYEWVFNYVNNFFRCLQIIDRLSLSNIEKMPKNLLKFLEQHNLSFTSNNIILCDTVNKCEKTELTFPLASTFGTECLTMFKYINSKTLQKIMFNSISKGNFDLTTSLRIFLNNINDAERYSINVSEIIDSNRGLGYNSDLIKCAISSVRDKSLNEKLQKLNFINNLEIDDYIVKVPQTQMDKIAEGKMQHNCVGSHYDKSILKGENLIYFLRKKNKPNHSYITCRYNIPKKNTVEYKKVNNSSVNSNKEKEIISQISKIIKENL